MANSRSLIADSFLTIKLPRISGSGGIGSPVTNTRSSVADAFVAATLAIKLPRVSGSGGIGAYLVDCDIVRKRKAEIQSSSPADLMMILPPRSLDESSAAIPLKELLASHSKLPPLTEVQRPNGAAQFLSQEKPSKNMGGRKPLPIENQRLFMIGRLVDQKLAQFKNGFELVRMLKINGFSDLDAARNELMKKRFTPTEADASLTARIPRGAAKRFVAKHLDLSLRTIHGYYSRYLKALRSKGSLKRIS